MIDLRSEAEILRQIDWESSLSPENKRLYRRYKANARRLFDQGRAQELLEATERLIDSHIFKIH